MTTCRISGARKQIVAAGMVLHFIGHFMPAWGCVVLLCVHRRVLPDVGN